MLTTGYTQHMLQTLGSKRIFYLDGKPIFLGGPGCPSPNTVSKCLARMTNWLQLCRHTIKAYESTHELNTPCRSLSEIAILYFRFSFWKTVNV